MATMYAIPALTTWSSAAGGWSNTSGGVSNGTWPSSTTDVIFDANSGPSRTITVAAGNSFLSLNTTASNAMTFSGSSVTAFGNVNLTGTVSLSSLQVKSPNSISLTTGSCTLGALSSSSSGGTVTLLSDLVMTGAFTCDVSFNANNFNVTSPAVVNATSLDFTMGSGTWTINGSGTVWDFGSFTGTFSSGTSTIKLTGNSASTIIFNAASKAYYNFWNNTTGIGSCTVSGVGKSFNNFRIDAGRSQTINGTTTVTTLTADGTAAGITITGSSSALSKAGGGNIYVDYCNITNLPASASSTFFARNSIDSGGNTNWTFIPTNTRFMSFF